MLPILSLLKAFFEAEVRTEIQAFEARQVVIACPDHIGVREFVVEQGIRIGPVPVVGGP